MRICRFNCAGEPPAPVTKGNSSFFPDVAIFVVLERLD